MTRVADLTGQAFGRWRVTGRAGHDRHGHRLWAVVCDPKLGGCGTAAERTASDLRKSGSCGCLRAEQVAARNRLRKGTGMPAEERKANDRERGRRYYHEVIVPDPAKRAAHARRVAAADRARRAVPHTCRKCRGKFDGPPSRVFCSRECLRAEIDAGTYRYRHRARLTEIEIARLAGELEERSGN